MASWRPPGSFWAAVGRQMASKTAPEAFLGGAGLGLGALGPLLAPLWAVLVRPGGPWEALRGSRAGLREVIVAFFGGQAEEAAEEVGKSSEILSCP